MRMDKKTGWHWARVMNLNSPTGGTWLVVYVRAGSDSIEVCPELDERREPWTAADVLEWGPYIGDAPPGGG